MNDFNLPKEKKGKEIRRMFSNIAPYYDFLNHFLSFNFDKIWRKKAAKIFSPKKDDLYLDLCCGTGDFGIQLAKLSETTIIGVDFSLEMLQIAGKKTKRLWLVNGDALSMPFKNETFDGCLVAFGIRNFENLERGIIEINRVLKEGSMLVILEFPNKVESVFAPIFNLYFRILLPVVGRIFSKSDFAYKYLPQSVKFFPPNDVLIEMFAKYGFKVEKIKKRTFGIVIEITARKTNTKNMYNND
ncbi:MAG: bifunctional demethylmenaquinone methyltransferase/2-methoxy-6-polyprenyl-1,4-benzoquinol methylase UbiE [Acidobacteria bacterium]|nr:bifunctional demethylmenaquinone methyltransferase/2-methoxy-6-polyprenyl-1,4-benzoquinol methylase UbiE [Acidobacteriota bacterium]